ncbi:C40 family peptidase [Actinocrinis puniceicyclus]|uniref:C40 family peptidase n=1 Tax=Actinocrinis puniceicyclus TaxID=977794 RepID=A0A8J7WMD3_9ACTN|nr:C40 family peptidase [Actinocrinis puniceicyclus]MBS2963440.1 C40 family peptidase [Actinocrinis puniceicyclus]
MSSRTCLVRATGVVAATAAAAMVPTVGHADPAQPGIAGEAPGSGPDAVKAEVSLLYQQAEADTQAYDATEERIARLQAAVAESGARAAQLRGRLAAATGALGRLAAAQYRDAGMSPTMALVFFAHPDSYLAQAGANDQFAEAQHQRVVQALRDRQALDELERDSAGELADLGAAQRQLAVHRARVELELARARDRISGLDAADRSRVAALLAAGDGFGFAPAAGTGDGLGSKVGAAAPSLSSLLSAVGVPAAGAEAAAGAAAPDPDANRAITAVSAAYAELGKPYVWGATGPAEFDCSGLTQHVWAEAGVRLPRTSQEQADAGRSVPLSDIRPGDLVIYFAGHTHVGIYVGKGLVIHAPRPGSVVQFVPLNAMPVAKVVRPEG